MSRMVGDIIPHRDRVQIERKQKAGRLYAFGSDDFLSSRYMIWDRRTGEIVKIINGKSSDTDQTLADKAAELIVKKEREIKANSDDITIRIYGRDGAGKTTLSSILLDAMKERGIKCARIIGTENAGC
jgi:polynucleotide 5'-kinase involved in rRNA processing